MILYHSSPSSQSFYQVPGEDLHIPYRDGVSVDHVRRSTPTTDRAPTLTQHRKLRLWIITMTNIHDLPVEVLEMICFHHDDHVLRRYSSHDILGVEFDKRETDFLKLSRVCRAWCTVILGMIFSTGTDFRQRFIWRPAGRELVWVPRLDGYRRRRRPAGHFLTWVID